jgi:hypothetical protein
MICALLLADQTFLSHSNLIVGGGVAGTPRRPLLFCRKLEEPLFDPHQPCELCYITLYRNSKSSAPENLLTLWRRLWERRGHVFL